MRQPGKEIADISMGQFIKGNFMDAAGGPFYCNIASGDEKPYRLTKEEDEWLNFVLGFSLVLKFFYTSYFIELCLLFNLENTLDEFETLNYGSSI